MNKCYSVSDLMSMYYEREFTVVEQTPFPKLSSKHNRKMKKAFRIFAENSMSMNNQPMKTVLGRPIGMRKRIIFTAIIVVLLAFITGGVIAFVSSGFRGTVYNDNTQIFALNIGDSPAVIEERYMLSVVPDGFELCECDVNDIQAYSLYKNSENQILLFEQTVKQEFDLHINSEGFLVDETVINGNNAIWVEFERQPEFQSLVVWDSNDYILSLYGNFTKETLNNLATSNEINGF